MTLRTVAGALRQAVACLAAVSAAVSAVVPAVALAELRIGISGPMEGKNSGSFVEIVRGAEIYFQQLNAGGGVHGQKVTLLARNDDFEVQNTVQVVKRLIEQDQVLALMLVRGTPHNQAILPLLAQHHIALVAPSTGAMVFHQPVNPYVFNVRTAYQAEARKLVALLKTTQTRRIAVLYVDDGFGKDALTGLNQGFTEATLQPTAVVPFDREAATRDSIEFVAKLVPQVVLAEPEVVIVVGAGLAVKNATIALRAAGSHATIATLSNNASTAFSKLMGEYARGTIVTQVFPDPKNYTNDLVREAQIAAKKSNVVLTTGMMEGYTAAKVLAKALKDAGPSPTRGSLLRTLDSLGRLEVGNYSVSYSPTDHTGLEQTDLSMITRDGNFLR